MNDIIPNSDEERDLIEKYSNISKASSKMIRSLTKEKRLPALKDADPSDTSLLALYFYAMKQEDYETCDVAKALIEQRGMPVTKWPSP